MTKKEPYPISAMYFAETNMPRAKRLACNLQISSNDHNDRESCRELSDTLLAICEEKPWNEFPLNDKDKKPLARTYRDWVELISGIDLDYLLSRCRIYFPDKAKEIDIKQAEGDADLVKEGAPKGNKNASKDGNKVVSVTTLNRSEMAGGHKSSNLLRRLAKKHPETLKQYEAGEFKSVRAAAIAAGIVKVKTPLEQLMHWWEKADETEQDEFKKQLQCK